MSDTAPPAAAPGRRATAQGASVYIAFVVLLAFDLAVTSGFQNPFVIRSLLFEAAPLILIALGQSLAIGTRGIDLSVGSVMGLAAAVLGVMLPAGVLPAAGLAILTGLVAGLFSGVLIAVLRIDPLISSLALLVAARGAAQAILNGSRVPLPGAGVLAVLGQGTVASIPYVAIIAFIVGGLFVLLVRGTTFGRYVIYAGSSRKAAFLAGMPVRPTLVAVYALSGLCAGVAGVFASARLGAADPNYIGLGFELDAIAAVVIGGTPLSGGYVAVIGSILGVLLLTVLDATFIMNNINANYAQILKAAFIICALYVQRVRA